MEINVLKKLICLFCLLGVFVSCSDDDGEENPFKGTDNSILSFQLTHEGVVYPGLLSTQRIGIQAATNITLEGATATYTISEHASISPDPAEIEEWDEPREFTVTSYNGEKKIYTYSVTRDAVASGGDVTLTTQAEVNAFAATGISIINGSLTIGKESAESEQDSIYDLSALGRVERIYYNLQLNPTYAGSDLTGFESLQQVGTLTIGDQLQNLKHIMFPKLVKINHQALTIQNSTVQTINFPALESCNEFSVVGSTLESINCNNLKEVAGEFLLNAPFLKTYSFDSLTEIEGNLSYICSPDSEVEEISFPSLEKLEGEMAITSWGNISALHLPQLAYIGTIRLTSVRLQNLEFPSLVSGESITIQYQDRTEVEFVRFPVLKEVGSLAVKTNTRTFTITEISLPALVDVTGTLAITRCNIDKIEIPLLEYIGGSLELDSPLVSELSFASLKEIGDVLKLDGTTADNTELTNLDGFSTLEKLNSFNCRYYKALVDYSGLGKAFKNSNPSWTVRNCAYNPTAADMENEKYIKE